MKKLILKLILVLFDIKPNKSLEGYPKIIEISKRRPPVRNHKNNPVFERPIYDCFLPIDHKHTGKLIFTVRP